MGAAGELGAVSRTEALLSRLHERVLDGSLGPGATVTEAMLVSSYAVSRPTARTAIAAAVAVGLLTQEPNKPAIVPIVTGEHVRDLFRVRVPLEVQAVRMLATHEVELAATVPQAAIALRPLGEVPLHVFATHDLRFHRELVASTGSAMLLHHWSLLERPMLMAIVQAALPMEADRVTAEHVEIVEAVQLGAVIDAEAVLERHLCSARDSLAFRVSVGGWGVEPVDQPTPAGDSPRA